MKWISLLLFAGCNFQQVEIPQAVIPTRGWPVVAVHIEGAGGDRTTVPFEMVTKSVITIDQTFLTVVGNLVAIALLCYVLKWVLDRGHN